MVAVVSAAGPGRRLGDDTVKTLVRLRGVTLLRRCVDGLLASGVVDLVVVVAPPELVGAARADLPPEVLVVPGGDGRSDSMRAGLDEAARVAPAAEHVLVHDAARALTPPVLVVDVVAALRAGAVAVVPAVPVVDTMKSVDGEGVVTGTPDRARLRAVQAPQGFSVEVLRAACAGAKLAIEDAGLVERSELTVRTVPGHPLAFKISTATDLALAEVLLAGSS